MFIQPDSDGFRPDGYFRPEIRERGLIDILGDAVYIYMAHIRRMLIVSAIVQLPASMLAFIQTQSLALTAAIALAGGVAGTVSYAAMIAAVGQCGATGRISVRGCYERVAWRGVSLLTLAALYAAVFAALVFQLDPLIAWSEEVAALSESAQDSESPGASTSETPLSLGAATGETAETPTETDAAALPTPPATALIALLALMAVSLLGGIYMTTTVPSIILEGRKGFGALARGFRLARGSEWRILGHSIVYLTVFLIVGAAFALPYVIAGVIIGDDSGALYAAGAATSSVFVQPFLYTAATLLYFDIRLKKEGYDAARLSSEMGAARV